MPITMDPQTDAEALDVFHAFRDHTSCPDCRGGYCDEYRALAGSMKSAADRGLSPYVVRMDNGVLRGAWDQVTADSFVRRFGGDIVKAPSIARRSGMLEHREVIAAGGVDNAWISIEDGEGWLNIRVYTESAVCKVYRFRADDARWLRACVVTAMAPVMRELEAREDREAREKDREDRNS
ncbi:MULTISPECIES: hypothetical protein [unclassified Kitasatospora]|uniref:hypothetical protein n=1 Tax=unclassified Kitasatospora TaxID=2633591 RepID=UPI002476BE65|nr:MULTISPECIES: hypothetical protein [unclassified Kitasatospora]MDH6123828.1 hypothetical protein [Kitasatospora sp. GP82]MDH6576073.1 hypothetical protein [Kitasatospora sp. MAP5-34]